VKFKDLPPQLPLFYSLPRGSEQLGDPLTLLVLPLSSLFIFIFNTLLGAYFYNRDIILSRILIIIGSFASIVLFITFIQIIMLIS